MHRFARFTVLAALGGVLSCGGGATSPDGGVDAGADLGGGMDAGTDGGTDAGMDAGVDAGVDAGTDAGCADADGDGHRSALCGGDDCDDTNPAVFPGRTEVCDAAGVDEDCDPSSIGPDRDGDGFISTTCCDRQPGSGSLLCGTDCDDTSHDISPTAPEVCDGVDDDCDGLIDEGVQVMYCRDADGDTYGDASMTRSACTPPLGYTIDCGDCNDANVHVNPGEMEACNGIDDDCNGSIDPGCACMTGATRACGPTDPSGAFITTGACRSGTQVCAGAAWGDCPGAVFPTAESCNGADDDCDGMTDEGVTNTYYADTDGDGYGSPTATVSACAAPAGYLAVAGDCDDTRASVHPGGTEVCNGLDDNCNGVPDEGVTMAFYVDADGDGYGGAGAPMYGCTAPAGYAAMSGDCRDDLAMVHPGQTYQTSGYCLPGSVMTGPGRCQNLGMGVYTTPQYDYDCNGVEQAEPAAMCNDVGSDCVLAIPPVPHTCGVDGFADDTAACGSATMFRTCGCGGGFCAVSDAPRTRGCR